MSSTLVGFGIIGVVDLSAANLAKCDQFQPEIMTTQDVRDLLQNPLVDTTTGQARRSRWGSPAPSHHKCCHHSRPISCP